jgi:hypothetical protein
LSRRRPWNRGWRSCPSAAALQLAGYLAPGGPTWYVALQGVIGVVQFAIAVAMLAGYRRCGIWGAF